MPEFPEGVALRVSPAGGWPGVVRVESSALIPKGTFVVLTEEDQRAALHISQQETAKLIVALWEAAGLTYADIEAAADDH